MSQSIHGHRVLNLILEAPEPFTRESLRAVVHEELGPDARYHTCSSEGMSLDELVTFLLERGKVTEQDGRLIAHAEEMCSHS